MYKARKAVAVSTATFNLHVANNGVTISAAIDLKVRWLVPNNLVKARLMAEVAAAVRRLKIDHLNLTHTVNFA